MIKRLIYLKNISNKTPINKFKNSTCECELKQTNKQMQNGGFIGVLSSLGIPLVSSLIGSLMEELLQTDRARKVSGLQVRQRNF